MTENLTLKGKKVAFFHADIHAPGGSERLMVNIVKQFEQKGAQTHILTFRYNPAALFNEAFQATVHELIGKGMLYSIPLHLRLFNFPRAVLALRRRLLKIKPDIIISRSHFESIYIYLATLLTPLSYATHIHTTISWDYGDIRQLGLIYRKPMRKITQSTSGHREFKPAVSPKANLVKKCINEITGLVEYAAVRKAKKIFVLSNQMKWEVKELYHKPAIVVKGAFPAEILTYKPQLDIKKALGLDGKRVVLIISRLTIRKRISLVIRAFQKIAVKYDDLMLVIGGTGHEENKLKSMVAELGIQNRVRFIGFVPDDRLWDHYASCDVFVNADWADFGIASYEALALQKKVVWSSEIEIDDYLKKNPCIFSADPDVNSFSAVIEKALHCEPSEKFDMSLYSWENYADRLIKELQSFL